MTKVLLLILLAAASLALIVILIRLAISSIFGFSYNHYQSLKLIGQEAIDRISKKSIKEEEELKRHRANIPKAHSELKRELAQKKKGDKDYEVLESENAQQEELEETQIVDIVKPIGFWTSMILGQKLTYLIKSAQIIQNRDNKKGFWVSMIEAKDRAAGRQQGRGR